MKIHVSLILVWTLIGSCFAAETKPNIILIYVDDWALFGSPVPMDESLEISFMPILEMPNVEKLARQGMRFTNAYGSPQCAPARASLQTGQSSPRNGFTLVLGGRAEGDYYDTSSAFQKHPLIPNISDASLDPDALTIPEALERFGYVSAHLGKWHLYSDPGAAGYALHDGDTNNKPGNSKDPKVYKTDPKLMFSTTEKAIGFMEEQVKAGNPFFCQISHYAMHEGRQCLEETRRKYQKHPLLQAYYKKNRTTADAISSRRDPATWLGMADDLDGRVGAVLDKIEALGIENNTYVVFASDNGYRHSALELTPGVTQPLHGDKWWAWQGGIRVPMIVKGPGVEPGSTFEGNVVNYDFLPTFYEWAGGDPSNLEEIDGTSLANFIAGEKPGKDFLSRNLYFHVPHYRNQVPHSSIISGNKKVIHFYEKPGIPMMFDLSDDPREVRNIAREQSETHERLFNEMMDFLTDMDARFPKANPDYDPEYYKSLKEFETNIMWGPFEGERPLEADEI